MSRDELQVRVAVLGPPFRPFIVAPESLSADTTGPGVSYADRPKMTIAVAPRETLGSVLTRAAVEFGFREMTADETAEQWGEDASVVFPLSEIIRFVDFYRPGDSVEAHHEPILRDLTGVDSAGVAYRRQWQDYPMDDLLRSSDEGLLPGDALRPYLVPYPPGGGDIWITTWGALRTSLDGAWWVLDKLSVLGGAWGMHEIARRVKTAREAIDENAEHWSDRGIDPAGMDLILRTRTEWRASNVAALFDCTAEQAEGILMARGWRFDESWGVWRAATVLRSRIAEAAAPSQPGVQDAAPLPVGQGKAALGLARRLLSILVEGPRRRLGARRYAWQLWLGTRGIGRFADSPTLDDDDEDDPPVSRDSG